MVSTDTTLRDLVGHYLTEQCEVILAAPPRLAEREPVVHSTRVAVRRLRSTLRVFDDLFDVPGAARLEEELVWWASLLGELRDLEIMAARLEAAIGDLPPELVVGPVSAALDREIAVRRKAAWERLAEAMAGERFAALLADVQRWRDAPAFTALADRPAGKVKGYVERADRKVAKRLAATGRAYAEGDPGAADLAHRARKAAKRHRYAVELAEPVLGGRAEAIVARRKDLQDVLGAHQDAVVCAAFLREVGIAIGDRRGHNGFTYGLLYAEQVHEEAQLPQRLAPFLP